MKDETIGASAQTAAFDQNQLAQLVRIAIGNRKIKEVMGQTGLSRSTISKLLNANATSLPSAETLLKLAGGSPNPLFWKMVEACGITQEQQEQLRKMHQLSSSFSADPHPMQSKWSAYTALSAVLHSLELGGYGTAFQIDYRSEGVFAVDAGEQYPLLIFIPITAQGKESHEILSAARKGLSYGFTQWELSDSVYFLLTDSQPVYELLQQLPNPTAQMAVALADEAGTSFRAQHVITTIISAYASPEGFPVNLNNSRIHDSAGDRRNS